MVGRNSAYSALGWKVLHRRERTSYCKLVTSSHREDSFGGLGRLTFGGASELFGGNLQSAKLVSP